MSRLVKNLVSNCSLLLLLACGGPLEDESFTTDPQHGGGGGGYPSDPVLDWNVIGLEATAGTPPGLFVQSRSLAIMHVAMYDALNSITRDDDTYGPRVPAPKGASKEAAIIAAAHRALVTLHPSQAAFLDAERDADLARIPNGKSKTDGINVGIAAANQILAIRANDGAFDTVPYTPGSGPGVWVPTPPAFAPALVPHWGDIEPWGMRYNSQFRVSPPPSLGSSSYATAYNEVKRVGEVDSPYRSQALSDVAQFYTPGGSVFWHPAARQVSAARGFSMARNARLFAHLSMAIADALIACWESKYHYNFWRPVTAIQNGEIDGNRATSPDPDWLPLIATPPFPSYPSGHATVAGAAVAVLTKYFGSSGFTVNLTSPALPGHTLRYTSWNGIAGDIDNARIYGGIHFRFDQQRGRSQGTEIGNWIYNKTLD